MSNQTLTDRDHDYLLEIAEPMNQVIPTITKMSLGFRKPQLKSYLGGDSENIAGLCWTITNGHYLLEIIYTAGDVYKIEVKTKRSGRVKASQDDIYFDDNLDQICCALVHEAMHGN